MSYHQGYVVYVNKNIRKYKLLENETYVMNYYGLLVVTVINLSMALRRRRTRDLPQLSHSFL